MSNDVVNLGGVPSGKLTGVAETYRDLGELLDVCILRSVSRARHMATLAHRTWREWRQYGGDNHTGAYVCCWL